MCFFRKKKVADKVKDDRELVEVNSKSVDALIILAKDNAEIVDGLKELQVKLKYLIPSLNPKVVDCDKIIKNKIGDMRIALTKSDGETTKKVTDMLTDIELAVADRNSNFNR